MINVEFMYELQNKEGQTIKTYTKEVKMPAAPTSDMVFSDTNFTFQANRLIQYDLGLESYFVRIVDDYDDDVDRILTELGWEK